MMLTSTKRPGFPVYANLHTHTTFCDGCATAEEMVKKGIQLGFSALGFSGHSFTAFEQSYCMSSSGAEEYRREIRRLQQQYQGQLDIFLGLEQDYFSDPVVDDYDFIIGSVHYVLAGGQYIAVDASAAVTEQAVREHFGGDYYAYAAAYYQLMARVAEQTRADFIGHFDLVSKFNEAGRYFDETSPRYRRAALEALEQAAAAGKPFEINTGAIYRDFRTLPYPSAFLLRALAQMGGEVLLSSDSHVVDSLGYMFAEAAELAQACGFRYVKLLTKEGLVDFRL